MKELIKKLLPKKYHSRIYNIFVKPFKNYYKPSYAQCGEDMILLAILKNKKVFWSK